MPESPPNGSVDIGIRYGIISNLGPYTSYQFRVRARNQYGLSEPSAPTIAQSTLPAVPRIVPDNITIFDGKVGSLNIQWNPFPKTEMGERTGYYSIWYRRNDQDWARTEQVFPFSNILIYSLCSNYYYILL